MKKIERRTRQKKWNMDQLRTKEMQFRTGIEESIQEGSEMIVERRGNRLKDTVMEKATEHVGYKKGKTAKKPWITSDMLDRMEERRRWKNVKTGQGKRK